jgi:hypothetical protein
MVAGLLGERMVNALGERSVNTISTPWGRFLLPGKTAGPKGANRPAVHFPFT